MNEFAIEADGLRKAFGPVTALNGLTLQVPTGSVVGLLGPNGSGKTTTVSILSTALRPDGGRAAVHGLDVVADAARVRAVIGFAGQFAAVDPNLTGRENLTLIGRLSRVDRRLARTRAEQLLDVFGLTDAADRLVRGYSGGMRRRLDLAAALVHRPPVLFLDEPTSGLDPESRFQLWDAVRDLARDRHHRAAHHAVPGRGGRAGRPGGDHRRRAGRRHRNAESAQGAVRRRGVHPGLRRARPTRWPRHGCWSRPAIRRRRTGPALRVRSDSGSGALPGLLRAIDRVPDPVSVGVREPTLDDVFLTLTGQVPASRGGVTA